MSHVRNTQVVRNTRSRRTAVLARASETDPWFQIDSADSLTKALQYCASLEGNQSLRADVIKEWQDEDWGDDAPLP